VNEDFEIETAQMRDLVLNGSFSPRSERRDASPTSRHAAIWQTKPFHLDAVEPAFVGLFGNQIETELLADNSEKSSWIG